MNEHLDDWFKQVEAAKPAVDLLAHKLENYGATVQRIDERDVSCIAYKVQFSFPGATTTIRIAFKDHHTRADLSITNMATLPNAETGKGNDYVYRKPPTP